MAGFRFGKMAHGTRLVGGAFGLMSALGFVACMQQEEPAVCGDGVVAESEECDSTNAALCTQPGDPKGGCRFPRCGDAVKQATEECDDGNDLDWDDCTSECRLPRCGDGVQQKDEECDDGNNDDHDGCTNACALAKCGDGIVRKGVEACDNGDMNDDKSGCTTQCALKSCGDGIVQPGEECDDGNGSNFDGCLNSCLESTCGDGFVNKDESSTEECDDGNTSNSDSCTNGCLLATCGDGYIQTGIEACDDGADNDDAGKCTTKCSPAKCGDGSVWEGHEECDDGVLSPSGDCVPGCKAATCGDGLLRTKSADPNDDEECDPGTSTGGNFCSPSCKKECTFGESAGGSDVLSGGHCYSVFTTPVTWEDASNACLIVGGHLVTIESAAENNALKAKVAADSWIGLTSKFSVGQFVWYQGPGKVLTLNYKNPGPGALSSLPNQCEVYSSSTQQWNDADCDATHGYICEFDY